MFKSIHAFSDYFAFNLFFIDRKSNKHSVVGKGNLDDELKFPDNNKAMTSKRNFDSADLFQFESQADKFSRPSSALSNRAMSPTNDLSSVFDQQKLDSLFTVKP